MHYYIMAIDLGGTHTSLPYKQDSILLPILGHYLGLISDESQVHWQEHNFFLFLTFCYAAIMTGFVYTAAYLRSRFGREPALLALVILALHPVILVLVNRIGVPDALTFLLTALILFQRSTIILFAVAFLGMTNHPLFLFIAPSLVLLRIYATSDPLSIRHLVAVLAGLTVGQVAVASFFQVYGIPMDQGRVLYLVNEGGRWWFLQAYGPLHLTVFSYHNFAWLAIIACVAYGFNRSRGYYVVLLLAQALAFAVASATQDPTRIFSLVAWASLVHCVVYTLNLARQSSQNSATDYTALRRTLLIVAGLGVLFPPFTVWSGRIQDTNFVPIWLYQNVIGPLYGAIYW